MWNNPDDGRDGGNSFPPWIIKVIQQRCQSDITQDWSVKMADITLNPTVNYTQLNLGNFQSVIFSHYLQISSEMSFMTVLLLESQSVFLSALVYLSL